MLYIGASLARPMGMFELLGHERPFAGMLAKDEVRYICLYLWIFCSWHRQANCTFMTHVCFGMGHPDTLVNIRVRLIFQNPTAFWAFAFATSAPQAFNNHHATEFDTMAAHDRVLFGLLDNAIVMPDYSSILCLGQAPAHDLDGRGTRSESPSRANSDLSLALLLFGAFLVLIGLIQSAIGI